MCIWKVIAAQIWFYFLLSWTLAVAMWSPLHWKLNISFQPNIFSEIIEYQENGGSGGIQTQIPNCTFYIAMHWDSSKVHCILNNNTHADAVSITFLFEISNNLTLASSAQLTSLSKFKLLSKWVSSFKCPCPVDNVQSHHPTSQGHPNMMKHEGNLSKHQSAFIYWR